jgi:5'(3')-deoxyribonucleotidase
MTTILCDIDDTILDLVAGVWLPIYNLEFNDTLTKDQIKSWNISEYVKPEAKDFMLEYVKFPDLFLGAEPIEGALKYINLLKSKGFRVVYVTINDPEGCKILWLKQHGFIQDDRDYVHAIDKSLIKGDIMIDDKIEHIETFRKNGGQGVLFGAPWNLNSKLPRVNSWEEFYNFLGYQL